MTAYICRALAGCFAAVRSEHEFEGIDAVLLRDGQPLVAGVNREDWTCASHKPGERFPRELLTVEGGKLKSPWRPCCRGVKCCFLRRPWHHAGRDLSRELRESKRDQGRTTLSSVNSSDVLRWLESLSHQITHLDEFRRRVEPQLASQFNVLRYARTDEIGLSQILADLLDPVGPHGQGARFLECFLKRYWDTRAEISHPVKVRTEGATDRISESQRRIDIVVDLGDRVLGIENKPWATDQPAQIADYLKHLSLGGRPFRLLYLAGHEGRLPSEDSISPSDFKSHVDQNNLVATNYHELREWLRDCIRCCESDRVAMFLRDLDRFIATRFSLDSVDFESKLIVETAMASAQGVAAAVQVGMWLAGELRLLLLEQLEDQLQDRFPSQAAQAGISGWSMSISNPINIKYATIEVRRSANSALKLALSFEGANCGDCFFGVGRRGAEDNSYVEAINKALDQEFGVGQRSAWWGWSRSFEPRYWWNDRRIWARIVDGSLASTIIELLLRMIRVVDQSGSGALFDEASRGPVPRTHDRNPVRATPEARAIHRRQDVRLIEHVLAVEAANWSLRRALADRVVKDICKRVEDSGSCDRMESTQGDPTEIYGGIGFRLRSQPALEVHVAFQSWGCRNAIYGLRQRDLDGKSQEAVDMRGRLVAVGLEAGIHSPGYIWYRSLETPNWFDRPEAAVAGYDGRIAERTASQISKLIHALEHAGLLRGDINSQPDARAQSGADSG